MSGGFARILLGAEEVHEVVAREPVVAGQDFEALRHVLHLVGEARGVEDPRLVVQLLRPLDDAGYEAGHTCVVLERLPIEQGLNGIWRVVVELLMGKEIQLHVGGGLHRKER